MKPVIERVEKLLRLASPKSGTTQHERESAALEVVRLIEEHDLIVRERKAKRSKTPPTTSEWSGVAAVHVQPQPTPRPPGDWVRSVARTTCWCCDPDCDEPISKGDTVWMRVTVYDVEFLHFSGPCGW